MIDPMLQNLPGDDEDSLDMAGEDMLGYDRDDEDSEPDPGEVDDAADHQVLGSFA